MGSRHEGPPSEKRALDAYVKLVRATNAVTGRIHAHLREDDLTVGQFAVLEALLHLGPLSQRDLCAKLLQSGGNVSMVVDHLEQRGLVERSRSAEDRRLVIVTLTRPGRQLIQRVFPRHARTVAKDFATLTAAEQKELARLCRKLGLAGPPAS